MMSSVRPPAASITVRMWANIQRHCSSSVAATSPVAGSFPCMLLAYTRLPIRVAAGIGFVWPNSST
jgi:hypothetical protein